MSRYAQIHEAAINDKRFGDGAFRTYCFLLTYMRENGCFPKVSTIAQKRGLHRATVSEHLNAAFKLGYLVISPHYRSDGGQGSNHYAVPEHLAIAPAAATNRDPPLSGIPDTPHRLRGDTMITESINRDSPLGGSDARARRGKFFFEEEAGKGTSPNGPDQDRRQQRMLLPFNGNGSGDRMAPLRTYNPSATVVDFAATLRVNALAEHVLGDFIDYYTQHPDKMPDCSTEAIEAAYRRWIRRQPRFATQSSSRAQRRGEVSDAENAAAADYYRRMQANEGKVA